MVRLKVRSLCDLGCESWSQKARVPGLFVSENRMILRLLVLTHNQCVTDGHAASS